MNIQIFDYLVDILQTLLWQYDQATAIQSLVTQKQAWYEENQTQFWTDWYNNVFNLQTANEFGLNVWAIILNIPLQKGGTPDPVGKLIFGFAPTPYTYGGSPGNLNFFRANFSNNGSLPALTINQQRLILRLRYFQLITRGAVLEINQFIAQVFPGVEGFTGTVYVLDALNMSMQYIFAGTLSQVLKRILIEYDILPRPAGVKLKIYSNITKIFGFGAFNQNFTNGSFIGDS